MADEINPGAAYLAALKRSRTLPATGTAPALTPECASSSEGQRAEGLRVGNGRKERRRSPRYRCQGSAHLRESATGIAIWATFTDISLHGCYVEMGATTFRVGAELLLILEVNDFRVEATGEVRVAYPGVGMGISFTSMRDREQLRALVRSIAQPSVILGPRATPQAASGPLSNALLDIPDPRTALQAIIEFFEQRHVMGRDEFLRILRQSRGVDR
jgi:PilZ domain